MPVQNPRAHNRNLRLLKLGGSIGAAAVVSLLAWAGYPEEVPSALAQAPSDATSPGATAGGQGQSSGANDFDVQVEQHARAMVEEGRQTFRFDTFGDGGFWGDTLKLHQAIQGADLGGVGPGLSPNAALATSLRDLAGRGQSLLPAFQAATHGAAEERPRRISQVALGAGQRVTEVEGTHA